MAKCFYRGHDTDKLDGIIAATLEKLEENDNRLTLKNGDDIEVYVDGDNWLVIDDPEYGGQIRRFNLNWEAIIEIMKMSRRGL